MQLKQTFLILFALILITPLVKTKQPKIVGLVPGRNESAIIEQCMRALALYTDAIVYLDDASTDNTLDIVKALAQECNIERIITKETWHRDEPGDRNKLLQAGREIGGTHFIALDADELPTANCLDNNMLRRTILALKPGESIMMNLIALWRSVDQYRWDNSKWSNEYIRCIFCDDGKSSHSSEFIHTGRAPGGLRGRTYMLKQFPYCILHFQFVNWRNLLIKQAWYRCLEHIRLPNKSIKKINEIYAPSKDERNIQLKPAPSYWFDGYSFFDPTVYKRPEGWREKQVVQWFGQHGKEYFTELDIWDIDWTY